MSKEDDNKATVGRWFTQFWGKTYSPSIVDELADGIEFFFVGGIFNIDWDLLPGLIAGFGAKDEELDTFG